MLRVIFTHLNSNSGNFYPNDERKHQENNGGNEFSEEKENSGSEEKFGYN